MMPYTLVGAAQLEAKLRQAGERAMPIIAGALNEIGDEVMGESKREAPWLTGALRNSGTNYGVEIKGTEAVDTLGYGGASIPYALYQHEGVGFNHPKGGKAHYLSDPVKARGARFAAQMSAKLRGRLERALAR
jgi:hypothetical protein